MRVIGPWGLMDFEIRLPQTSTWTAGMSEVPAEFRHCSGPPLPVLSPSPFRDCHLPLPRPGPRTQRLVAPLCIPLLQGSVGHEVVGMWGPQLNPFSAGPTLRRTEAGSVNRGSFTPMPFLPLPTAHATAETPQLPGALQLLMALSVLHTAWGPESLINVLMSSRE